MSIKIGAIVLAGVFNFYPDYGLNQAIVHYAAPADLNGDGVDEVLFFGHQSQGDRPQQHYDTMIHVYEWRGNRLVDATNKWFPDGINKISGANKIVFGDFNGDSHIDLFAPSYTDSDYSGEVNEFLNRGGFFERVGLGLSKWQHDLSVYDFNGDGISDVYATGYLGAPGLYLGARGGVLSATESEKIYGSGIGVADYFGDGSVGVVISDSANNKPSDTILYSASLGGDAIWHINERVRLPSPYFLFLSGSYANGIDPSHDVRSIPFDFSGDGLVDDIIISRPWIVGNLWPQKSHIQFLKNQGGGVFVDSTSQYLVGYDENSNASYLPIIIDVNGDGRKDIYLSEASYVGPYNSTALLMQDRNGRFIDSYRKKLSSIIQNKGGISTIVKGPRGYLYIVQTRYTGSWDSGVEKVYYSKISVSK